MRCPGIIENTKRKEWERQQLEMARERMHGSKRMITSNLVFMMKCLRAVDSHEKIRVRPLLNSKVLVSEQGGIEHIQIFAKNETTMLCMAGFQTELELGCRERT